MSTKRNVAVALTLLTLAFGARAAVIADSVADFSGVQATGNNWSYGIFNQGLPATPYDVAAFELLDIFDGTSWSASDALVGADNNNFLNLSALGGHPTGLGPAPQDTIIWAVRRYESPIAGSLKISFDLAKQNVVNTRGGGITGHIFVDGVSVLDEFIANDDAVGIQGMRTINVSVGSVIDFAIDPAGISPGPPITGDGDFSARADGSRFTVVVRTVEAPEPGTLALLAGGLLLVTTARRTTG